MSNIYYTEYSKKNLKCLFQAKDPSFSLRFLSSSPVTRFVFGSFSLTLTEDKGQRVLCCVDCKVH